MWLEIGLAVAGGIGLPGLGYLFKRNMTFTSKITEYDLKFTSQAEKIEKHVNHELLNLNF